MVYLKVIGSQRSIYCEPILSFSSIYVKLMKKYIMLKYFTKESYVDLLISFR